MLSGEARKTWTMIFLLKQRHLKLSNYVCDFMFIELKINSNNSVLQMHLSKSLNFTAFSNNGPPRFLNYKGAGLLAVSALTNILNLFIQYSKVKKYLAKGTIKYSKCMHILKKKPDSACFVYVCYSKQNHIYNNNVNVKISFLFIN